MRTIILCALLFTICLFTNAQGNCKFGDRDLTVGEHHIQCIKYTCYSDGHVSALACPLYICQEGKQTGYQQQDLSKPYPECCEGPICGD